MYQKIVCANCHKVSVEFSGDGWLEEGWVPCWKCGQETRVIGAMASSECRPIEHLGSSLPIRTQGNEGESDAAASIRRSEADRRC